MTSSSSKTIAIFDFDGTMTYCDTLFFFFLYTVPMRKLLLGFPKAAYFFMRYVLRIDSNHIAKQKFFYLYLKGMEDKKYKKKCKQFAERIIPLLIKKKALKRIQWHKKQKHTLFICSSSLKDYVFPYAKKQGFKNVISTEIKMKKGKIEGSYVSYNCWGPRKIIMFEKAVGPMKKDITYVYGNSRGDKEILKKATHPFYRRFQ